MSFTFFTDRDLGRQFPKILEDAGLIVERHADHFAADAPDEEWLPVIGTRGWIALTHDGRIRYKPSQKKAVFDHDVRLLVIIGKSPFPELAHAFVSTRWRIDAFLQQHTAPFIAKVHRASASELKKNPDAPGSVTMWLS